MGHGLLKNQNSPESIELLKASSIAYSKAKSKEFVFTYTLCFLAIAYPIAYFFLKNETLKEILFGISFAITASSWVLADYFKGNTSKGALLKELFDTRIFQLHWKFFLNKPESFVIIELAKNYKGATIKNWYPDNILESINNRTATAICHRIGSYWDIILREKYRNTLQTIIIIYTIIVFIVWVALAIDGRTIFFLYFSTLSFYTHFITLIRGNNITINKRKAIICKLDKLIEEKTPFTYEDLRDIQDEILLLRQEPSKVHNFFYKKYNPLIRQVCEEYLERINSIYLKW